MFASWKSFSLFGLEAVPINIEADLIYQLPSFNIVGMASSNLKEARDRVRSAIKNSGFDFPIRRITVNLSPATLRKERISLDLPIALSILEASGQFKRKEGVRFMAIGELSLDGSVSPCPGVLISLLAARNEQIDIFLIPRIPRIYRELIQGIDFPFRLIEVGSLKETVQKIETGEMNCAKVSCMDSYKSSAAQACEVTELESGEDFSDLIGLESAKRALMIAALGGHHVILAGSRGSGKSALSNRFPSLLSPLRPEEKLEIAALHDTDGSSLIENLCSENVHSTGYLIHSRRPVRKPHSGITHAAMFGGGNPFSPGEVSLSHHGLLYLDEFQDFKKEVIESLRQPLQDRKLTVSRARVKVSVHCGFQLICTMNLCPCGAKGSWSEPCRCMENQLIRFRSKISEAILDRIPIRILVQKSEKIDSKESIMGSDDMRKSLLSAREFQKNRAEFKILPQDFERVKKISKHFRGLSDLSNRSLKNTFMVARSVSDLENSESILTEHIEEALWLGRNPFT